MPDSRVAPERLPSHKTTCMGCGPDNLQVLQLVAHRSGDDPCDAATFGERPGGAPGLTHGGVVAAAGDDVWGYTLRIVSNPAVTRTLTVEYLRPVPLQQLHRITTHVTSYKGQAVRVTETGTNEGGVVRFTGRRVLAIVSPEHFAAYGNVSAFGDLLEHFSRCSSLDDGPS